MSADVAWLALTLAMVGLCGGVFWHLTQVWVQGVCGRAVPKGVYIQFGVWSLLGWLALYGASEGASDRLILGVCLELMLMLALIDAQTGYIPNVLVYPLLALGVFAHVLGPACGATVFGHGVWSVGSALLGWMVFAGMNALHQRVYGAPGMGMGDVKLMAALCALLGFLALPFVAFVAACTFLASHRYRAVMGKADVRQLQPFGPHLAMAAVVFLVGDFYVYPERFNRTLLTLVGV